MNASERREEIKTILAAGDCPVSASALAARLGVSRQVVVGDVALLRASGADIFATPRGYLLRSPCGAEDQHYTISCRHSEALLLEELYTIVDLGGRLVDVIVEHPVYGEIRGNLHVASRYDADLFYQSLRSSGTASLSSLTGGVHLHTISCPTPDVFERITLALDQKGILFGQ